MTSFVPFYLPTEDDAPRVNLSMSHAGPGRNLEPPANMLQSNYTIELSFPDGAHVYQSVSQS